MFVKSIQKAARGNLSRELTYSVPPMIVVPGYNTENEEAAKRRS
jgi:hypothetical protein